MAFNCGYCDAETHITCTHQPQLLLLLLFFVAQISNKLLAPFHLLDEVRQSGHAHKPLVSRIKPTISCIKKPFFALSGRTPYVHTTFFFMELENLFSIPNSLLSQLVFGLCFFSLSLSLSLSHRKLDLFQTTTKTHKNICVCFDRKRSNSSKQICQIFWKFLFAAGNNFRDHFQVSFLFWSVKLFVLLSKSPLKIVGNDCIIISFLVSSLNV